MKQFQTIKVLCVIYWANMWIMMTKEKGMTIITFFPHMIFTLLHILYFSIEVQFFNKIFIILNQVRLFLVCFASNIRADICHPSALTWLFHVKGQGSKSNKLGDQLFTLLISRWRHSTVGRFYNRSCFCLAYTCVFHWYK